MAYQALYRTWRPMVFDDVAGQEHITKTLKNEIKTGNLAHAYLFCGTRGTGKTSTAKILARAVNCLNPKDGNPCNECEICKGILDDSILDVVEMDGASRNKVENIRELIDDVAFLPTRTKKKVYIIDEVHMVTTQAFNALLKTLEEPPEHVLFILATTELNKIPPTVLSRCQRFDFKRITQNAICDRLQKIANASDRKITPEALRMVAELGDGSMRDSLSILEQVLGYTDEEIGYNELLTIMGIADHEALFSICQAIAENDSGQALSVFDTVIENGKEPEVFIDRLTHFLRDVLVTKITRQPEQIVNTSQEHLAKMKTLADAFSREKLIFALKTLNEAVVSAKASGYGRTVYELALVKLAEPAYDSSFEALFARVADLETKLAGGTLVAAPKETHKASDAPPWEAPAAADPAAKKPAATPAPKPEVPEKKAESGSILDRFDEIKEYVRAHGGAPVLPHINRATPMMLQNQLSLVFPKDAMMNKTVVARAGNLELIQIAVQAITGEEVKVQCLSEKEAGINSAGENDAFDRLLELGKEHSEIEII
ncbi:MAG: DNA polymerase III subunit gamma/tau [Clostridia bacterium]|nr:DNA polymerase III subunit gamma/tau [Clostridia bacterium]